MSGECNEALSQCCFIVDPPSYMVTQLWNDIGSMPDVWWRVEKLTPSQRWTDPSSHWPNAESMLRHRRRNILQNKVFYIESFSRHFERFTNLRTSVMPVTSEDAGPPEAVSEFQINKTCMESNQCQKSRGHPLTYERVYLPLCKVADTPFHIQGDEDFVVHCIFCFVIHNALWFVVLCIVR